jgi:hypothetical protein
MGQCKILRIPSAGVSSNAKLNTAQKDSIRNSLSGNSGLQKHLKANGFNFNNAEIQIQKRGRNINVVLVFKQSTGGGVSKRFVCLPSRDGRAIKKYLPRGFRAEAIPPKAKQVSRPSIGGLGSGGFGLGAYRPGGLTTFSSRARVKRGKIVRTHSRQVQKPTSRKPLSSAAIRYLRKRYKAFLRKLTHGYKYKFRILVDNDRTLFKVRIGVGYRGRSKMSANDKRKMLSVRDKLQRWLTKDARFKGMLPVGEYVGRFALTV